MLQRISERQFNNPVSRDGTVIYGESNRRRGLCAILIFQRCYRVPDAVGMNISVATSPA